jgi:hypothetical protein
MLLDSGPRGNFMVDTVKEKLGCCRGNFMVDTVKEKLGCLKCFYTPQYTSGRV